MAKTLYWSITRHLCFCSQVGHEAKVTLLLERCSGLDSTLVLVAQPLAGIPSPAMSSPLLSAITLVLTAKQVCL